MLSRSLAAHADRLPRSGYRGSDFVLWHEPSVPATARVGPEVGVELPMVRVRGADRQQSKTVRRGHANRLAKNAE
jgi:hypothetical protein